MTKKRSIIIVLTVVCALALVLTGCKSQEQLAAAVQTPQAQSVPDVYVTNEAQKTPSVIVVTGSGETTLAPDMAKFSVRIKTEDIEAEKAQQLNTETSDAVIAALKAAGVAEKDISTSNLNLNERYDYSKDTPEFIGYEMSHELSVTVRDINKLGQTISDAIAAGATETYGLQLTVSSSDSAYADALKIAVESAENKAKAVADALGVTLVEVPAKVTEMSSSYSPATYRNYDMATMAAEPAAPDMGMTDAATVSSGELTVNAEVEVTYEIVTAE